jgi:cytoplasmic iron level regulating protein YaaA (DUF328/UPF0246 family)
MWIKTMTMPTLLVQSCSKSKNQPATAVPALELYSGYFFKIIKKARREGALVSDIDICILSAEYGLLSSDSEIDHYDRRMDTERARELAPDVQAALETRVANGYDRVIVNVGGAYQEALEGIRKRVEVPVHYIEGAGIGEKGRLLKQVIRGDLTPASLNGESSSVTL